ncbi:sulfatase [Echinococcus multilocularis]|uniref:Sulfatase n=1 Tax=Echinococcus multilocularis TaxID=6211 RepID=A0A0S4MRV4_ECHMU|nr:sulfatase [Echinococcus multilocularis]
MLRRIMASHKCRHDSDTNKNNNGNHLLTLWDKLPFPATTPVAKHSTLVTSVGSLLPERYTGAGRKRTRSQRSAVPISSHGCQIQPSPKKDIPVDCRIYEEPQQKTQLLKACQNRILLFNANPSVFRVSITVFTA